MEKKERTVVTGSLMVAIFLAAMEVTIVNAAMPTVVSALGGIALYSWVFSAFMLANTTTVPLFGKLADLFGRKRVFQIAVLLFVAGSGLCGLAGSMEQLVLFRAIQGLGAGGVLPLAMTIVGDIYPLEQRAKMQGVFSSMWGLAAVVGPFIGGFIVDHFSWRWLFWLNLPFGILVIALVQSFFREVKEKQKVYVDYAGAALLTLSVLAFLYGTLLVGEHGLKHFPAWMVFALSLAGFIAFFAVERRSPEPFVPLHLFANKMISSSNLTAFLAGMGMFGAISFVPLFVQGVLKTSATLAGFAITPQVIGWSFASVIAGRLILRTGYRLPIVGGMAIMVLSGSFFVLIGKGTPYWLVLAAMFLLGIGLGLAMTAFIVGVQGAVKKEQRGVATSLQMFSRSMGAAVGVTVLGSILTANLKTRISNFIAANKDHLSSETMAQLKEAQGIAQVDDVAQFPRAVADQLTEFLALSVHTTLTVATGMSVLALIAAILFIPKGSAQSLSVN